MESLKYTVLRLKLLSSLMPLMVTSWECWYCDSLDYACCTIRRIFIEEFCLLATFGLVAWITNNKADNFVTSDNDWPPLWSSGQSSWLQIKRSGFNSRRYQIFWEVMGLERGPLSLVSTTEELLERKSSGFSLENLDYGHSESAVLTTRHPSVHKS
jgi:hypothetical protein